MGSRNRSQLNAELRDIPGGTQRRILIEREMKNIKILFLTAVFMGAVTSCQDQLDITNPNEPTTDTLENEKGFVKFALGGVYINGFVDIKTAAFADGTLGAFWANGFHDIMA